MRLCRPTIIVEERADGFVAYPVGLRGVIVGQGDTLDEATTDVTSAIKFRVETFGATELEMAEPLPLFYLILCLISQAKCL